MELIVHVPIDPYSEAFGQVYVEALAAGVPMICTLSGIAPVFIRDAYNALIVPYCDSRAIENAILQLLGDHKTCEYLVLNGRSSISEIFSLDAMCGKLRSLYLEHSL
jgi:glycosyltransferase involved in cell wall biosynthesis